MPAYTWAIDYFSYFTALIQLFRLWFFFSRIRSFASIEALDGQALQKWQSIWNSSFTQAQFRFIVSLSACMPIAVRISCLVLFFLNESRDEDSADKFQDDYVIKVICAYERIPMNGQQQALKWKRLKKNCIHSLGIGQNSGENEYWICVIMAWLMGL